MFVYVFCFVITVIKIFWQKQVKGEKAYFGLQFQMTVHRIGELTAAEVRELVLSQSQSRTEQLVQACLLVLSLSSSFYTSRITALGMVSPTVTGASWLSNLVKTISHRQGQWFIFNL